jgi:hypothetical protein
MLCRLLRVRRGVLLDVQTEQCSSNDSTNLERISIHRCRLTRATGTTSLVPSFDVDVDPQVVLVKLWRL